METENYFTEGNDINKIINEEYFLVEVKNTSVLTKVQYTNK
jgi:hypothetical protein